MRFGGFPLPHKTDITMINNYEIFECIPFTSVMHLKLLEPLSKFYVDYTIKCTLFEL